MVDLPEPEPPTSAVILPGGKIPLKLYRTWTAGLRMAERVSLAAHLRNSRRDSRGLPARVDKVDVFQLDQTFDRLGPKSRLGRRVDNRNTVNRRVDLGRGTARERDGLQVRRELRERESTDEDREEDVDDLARGDATLEEQGGSVVECETVGAVDDEEEDAETETVEASRLEADLEPTGATSVSGVDWNGQPPAEERLTCARSPRCTCPPDASGCRRRARCGPTR